MIRSSRLFFFGRKNYNVPLFTQRAALSPKQIYMEFSVIVNTEAVSEEKLKMSPLKHADKNQSINVPGVQIQDFESEYSFLKVMLKDGSRINSLSSSNLFKDFLQKLTLYKTSDIIKLLKTLAFTGNRAIPAIKPLCETLLYRNHNFKEKECSELLFFMAKLSYKNEPLIKIVMEHLKSMKNIESLKTVISVLHSMSILKHRDCEVIDKLLNSYTFDSSYLESAVDILVSLGHLNYSPHTVDIIIKSLSDFEETDYQQTKNYIDYIWACVLLNKHTSIPEKHFRKVLSRSFFEKLELGREGLYLGTHLKIINIFAAASRIPSLKEVFQNKLPQQSYLFTQSLPLRKNVLLESVKDTLSYIFPKSANLETLVDTKAGFYLDFQCILDSKSSPLLVKNKETCKLGIVLLNYHDICSDGTMSGLSAFKLNILTSQGYKMMTVSYLDYPINAKLSEKIVYLRNAINDTINNSLDSDKEKAATKEKL